MGDTLPNVALHPRWNERVSAADRLRELALIAEKHPERFEKFYIAWIGERDGRDYHSDHTFNMQTVEVIGWMEVWKHCLLERTNKEV